MANEIDLKGLMFDFDGTVADTLPLCIKAFQEAFLEVTGVLYEEAEITKHFGKSEEGIIQNIAPDKYQECLTAYYRHFEQLHHICPNLFDGVIDILDYLKSNDYKLALITGRGKGAAEISLKYYGIDKYFEYVEAGSILGSIKTESMERILSKWNMKASNAVYIGDAPSDVLDSRKAGVFSVAAAWAPDTNKSILSEQNPDFTFTKIEDFKNWLVKLKLGYKIESIK